MNYYLIMQSNCPVAVYLITSLQYTDIFVFNLILQVGFFVHAGVALFRAGRNPKINMYINLSLLFGRITFNTIIQFYMDCGGNGTRGNGISKTM